MNIINWERPNDAKLTWFWDDYLCPKPAKPLTQSFYPYTLQSFYKNQRELFESNAEFRGMFFNGYFYVYFKPATQSNFTHERAEQCLNEWEGSWLNEIKANLEKWRSIKLADLANDELTLHLQNSLQIVIRHWDIEGQIDGPSLRLIHRFIKWYKERFPKAKENEAYFLLADEAHVYKELNHELSKQSNALTPEIRKCLEANQLSTVPDDFQSLFNHFLQNYGRKTEQMYDIASPTLIEDPAPIIKMLLKQSETEPEEVKTVKHLADNKLILQRVEQELTNEELDVFHHYLYVAKRAMLAKENHKFYIEQCTPGEIRLVCAEIGRRMHQLGILSDVDDVSFLTISELIQFGFGLSDTELAQKIEDRKANYHANLEVAPLEEIGGLENSQENNEQQDIIKDLSEIKGIPASVGKITGKARVLNTIDDIYNLQKGEILICQWTDPDWTPMLKLAAGIVTDTGGALSHAAIVAREYGIPAVLNTKIATAQIITGQMIEVDGSLGLVRLFEKIEAS